MTADPYPKTLDEIDFAPPESVPQQSAEVKALNRIAVALEQLVLTIMDKPAQPAPQPALTQLPPVRPPQTVNTGYCPIHQVPWRIVPAGVSKKTAQPYDAFQACSVRGCDQRPPRA
jgi:hypothetical protein